MPGLAISLFVKLFILNSIIIYIRVHKAIGDSELYIYILECSKDNWQIMNSKYREMIKYQAILIFTLFLRLVSTMCILESLESFEFVQLLFLMQQFLPFQHLFPIVSADNLFTFEEIFFPDRYLLSISFHLHTRFYDFANNLFLSFFFRPFTLLLLGFQSINLQNW